MKCLESERLMNYAFRLIDEPAAREVRLHLDECPRCRSTVEQYLQLDAVLNEWKAAEPSPEFDARVRQSIEAQPVRRMAWAFWSWQGRRGLALAALGVLIVAGALWFAGSHRRNVRPSLVAKHSLTHDAAPRTPAPSPLVHSPGATLDAQMRPADSAAPHQPAANSWNDDRDAQALEDYDLAANFDLLSEIPRRDARVAN
jgi:anti-sigma factor RsiW